MGSAALCVEGLVLRGPVVAFAAALTAAVVLLATRHHDRVVAWSDAHGPLANLAAVPPAFVAIACARRTMPLPVAALLALGVGLGLAVLWLLVAPRRTAPPAVARVVAPAPAAPVAPARLWSRQGREPVAAER